MRPLALSSVLLLAGCALLPVGPSDSGPDDDDAHSVAFEAPDTIDDWTTVMAWSIAFDEENGTEQAVKNEQLRAADRTVDEHILSDDYGADAVVEDYQRDDLQQLIRLRMVATEGDSYFVQASASDAAWMGTDSAQREVQHFGDVECFVIHTTMSEESEDNSYSECMMRSESLTLWLGPTSLLPQDVADLTEDAWNEVGGGDTIGPSSASIDELQLPDIDGFVERSTVMTDQVDKLAEWREHDLEALATAYGVDAGARFYTSPGRDSFISLYLVDTEIVAPYIGYIDPERLGLVAPVQQRTEIDGATCLVTNTPVRFGGDPADLDTKVQLCYFSEGGRTAFAYASGAASDDTALIPAILKSVL